jgi:DNA-binding MarR family transcriptional regulator
MQATAASSLEHLTDQLVGLVAYLLKTTQGEALQVAGELDITMSQLRALFVLSHVDHDPALSELADVVGLSVAAMGRATDGLVRAGLVSRREDENDRRIKRLALTPQGEELLDRIAEARRAGVRRFVEHLDDDAREQFARALNLIPADLGCGPIHGEH